MMAAAVAAAKIPTGSPGPGHRFDAAADIVSAEELASAFALAFAYAFAGQGGQQWGNCSSHVMPG